MELNFQRTHRRRLGPLSMKNDAETSASQLDLDLTPSRRLVPAAPPKGTIHKIAGLFAGVGGLERGLHRAGHSTVLLCENDPAASAVLRAKFTGIKYHADVTDLEKLPRSTTLVAAGFPCQDLSQAGQTAGISGLRSGLVSEVFRLIKKHQTPWVLLENVPFMLQLSGGRAMNVITSTLEELGYRWAYRVIDARAFGLPQRRRRVYLLASLRGDPRTVLFADDAGHVDEPKVNGNSAACGFYWTEGIRGLGWAVDAIPTLKGGSTVGIPSPPAILLPSGEVVMPDIRDAERLQGFPANWTKVAEKVARSGTRWKLIGNAVSVPAAAWLGSRMARPGRMREFPLTAVRGTRWPTAAWNMGDGRVAVDASEWPVRRRYASLLRFLRYAPRPLSAKATRGFLERTERSGLRFPEGFLQSLRAHEARMTRTSEFTLSAGSTDIGVSA